MNKLVLMVFLCLITTSVISQKSEYEPIYFIEFKVYQADFDNGVPFAEICFTDKKDDFIFNCITTDFDGFAFFHINPNEYNLDSTYFRIKLLVGHSNADYGKPTNIPLNRIDLLKDNNLEKGLKISLTKYEILNEKEYQKHRKKYGLMPKRQPSKAIDVE